METKYKYYVYTHTRPDTDEVFYVGKGKLNRSKEKSGRSIHWNNVVKRNDGNYIIRIVTCDLIEEDAFLHETYLINLYGRRDLGNGNLINRTDGGDGSSGVIPSAETRAKLSRSRTGKKRSAQTCAKIGAVHKGRKHTDVARLNMSLAHKGQTASEAQKQKMREWSKDPERTKEQRKKLSEAGKGRKLSDKHKEILSALKTGSKLSAETIAKRTATRRLNGNYSHSEAAKKMIGDRHRGKIDSDETKRKRLDSFYKTIAKRHRCGVKKVN